LISVPAAGVCSNPILSIILIVTTWKTWKKEISKWLEYMSEIMEKSWKLEDCRKIGLQCKKIHFMVLA